jgi:hypothetical protein
VSADAAVFDPEEFSVGARVEARYGFGNEWFPATVSEVQRVTGGGPSATRYFLQYDDGDVEEGASRLKLRVAGQRQRRQLVVGEWVSACCAEADDLVVSGRVLATPESSADLEADHYLVSFDRDELELALGTLSRNRSAPGADVVSTLHRRFIFGAFT